MISHSDVQRYINYDDDCDAITDRNNYAVEELARRKLQNKAEMRTALMYASVFMFFALLFTFYFNNMILVGIIFYLIAVAIPLRPLFASFMELEETDMPDGPPTDEEVDELFLHEFKQVMPSSALSELRLDDAEVASDDILMMLGPVADSELKTGNDGATRYGKWSVMALVMLDKYVSIYQGDFDWMGGGYMSNESTVEYFYNDILTVKTGGDGEKKTFKIVTVSGDSVELGVNDDNNTPDCYQVHSYASIAVDRFRKMLRENKYPDIDMEVLRPKE